MITTAAREPEFIDLALNGVQCCGGTVQILLEPCP